MKDRDMPMTTAVHARRAAGIAFIPNFYDYIDHGGTKHAADFLGVHEHAVVKTLVMEVDASGKKNMVLVLMHGDREVSTKQLARFLEVKAVSPASEATVYIPGGVSPFGTRTSLLVYVEETILTLDRIYINGGKRGFLVEMKPGGLTRVLNAIPMHVGIEPRR